MFWKNKKSGVIGEVNYQQNKKGVFMEKPVE